MNNNTPTSTETNFDHYVTQLQEHIHNIPTNTPENNAIITDKQHRNIRETVSKVHLESLKDSRVSDTRKRLIIKATDIIEYTLMTLSNTTQLTRKQECVIEDIGVLVEDVLQRKIEDYQQLIAVYEYRVKEAGLYPDVVDVHIPESATVENDLAEVFAEIVAEIDETRPQ